MASNYAMVRVDVNCVYVAVRPGNVTPDESTSDIDVYCCTVDPGKNLKIFPGDGAVEKMTLSEFAVNSAVAVPLVEINVPSVILVEPVYVLACDLNDHLPVPALTIDRVLSPLETTPTELLSALMPANTSVFVPD